MRSSFPLYHILIILTSIVIFILISSIFIACKLNIIKKTQKKKRVQYVGQPVFYKYSPTNSMDYLGKLKRELSFEHVIILYIFLRSSNHISLKNQKKLFYFVITKIVLFSVILITVYYYS
jgi:hypothetical protein